MAADRRSSAATSPGPVARAGRSRLNTAVPRARFGPTANARIRGALRRPFSLSQLCVVSAPWTITGSPLLTDAETLLLRPFQHSTSTHNVPASTNCCVLVSYRRAVEAMRRLVTDPSFRLTRRGESTTLPTTVTMVSFTVLLGTAAPDDATGALPVCDKPRCGASPTGAPPWICGRALPLWTGLSNQPTDRAGSTSLHATPPAVPDGPPA